MREKCTLGILVGDAAGVGPELVAKTSASGYLAEQCNPLILTDRRIFQKALDTVGAELDYHVAEGMDSICFDKGVCIYDMHNLDPGAIVMGRVSAACGQASVDAIDLAVSLWRRGVIHGATFAPFNKASIKAAVGEGYTSELAYMRTALGYDGPTGEINHVNNIWTSRATGHIPFFQLSELLTKESIENAIALLYSTLKQAGYANPRIGVAALNPHCGENGTCGNEETMLIAPAIEEMNARGMNSEGPYAADTIFDRAVNHGEFDGIVTLFHDQGQIALKLWGFEQGVTIEGGLPMLFTTASQGSAFNIAGKGVAKTTAFELAVRDAALLSGIGR